MMETIWGVALRSDRSGLHALPRPNRHVDVIRFMVSTGHADDVHEAQQGFVTSTGRFVDRREGLRIALESGQVIEEQRPVRGLQELFSEDLW